MESLETAYPFRVTAIAIVFGAALITAGRVLWLIYTVIDRRVSRFVPQRVSYVLTTLIIGYLLIVIVNGVLARSALNAADSIFLPDRQSSSTKKFLNQLTHSHLAAKNR